MGVHKLGTSNLLPAGLGQWGFFLCAPGGSCFSNRKIMLGKENENLWFVNKHEQLSLI
jgi:hypothetical protein